MTDENISSTPPLTDGASHAFEVEQLLASPSPAWEIAAPEPLTLLALSESIDDGPLAAIARIDAYLLAHAGGSVLPIEDLGGDGGARWSVVIRIPQRTNAIVLFSEDPQQFVEHAPQLASLSSARAAIGLSTPLESPYVADLIRLVCILNAAAGEMLALVDPALDAVRLREDVVEQFLAAEPLADERALFRTQIVARADDAPRWLFTEGMPRVGKPDFEMLEVVAAEERSAITLVEVTASLFIARQLPPPETPFEIGMGVTLALVSPREALQGVGAEVVGSARDRIGEQPHFHPRPSAVICAPSKRGAYRQVWTRPVEAIAALQRGEAMLAMPEGIVRSTALRARRSWSDLVQLKSDKQRTDPILAQVNIVCDGTSEHAWVEVVDASASGGTGLLLHALRDGTMHKGAHITFTLDQVSDWSA
ncbi:MAG: hypothetical protein EXS10_03915 [Phycisphaerales bacterium]|nr:hypothetical protein [Phycisphaerales bacterium]